eukprot:scaffold231813_cov19-Tisochrysis_lutea.AAC.1
MPQCFSPHRTLLQPSASSIRVTWTHCTEEKLNCWPQVVHDVEFAIPSPSGGPLSNGSHAPSPAPSTAAVERSAAASSTGGAAEALSGMANGGNHASPAHASRLSYYIDGAHTPESMDTCAQWFAQVAHANGVRP